MRKSTSIITAVVLAAGAVSVTAAPANADRTIPNTTCSVDSVEPSRPTSALTMYFSGTLTCASPYPGYNGAVQARVERRRPDGVWEVVATAPRNPSSGTTYVYNGASLHSSSSAACVAGPLRTQTIVNVNGTQYIDYSGEVRLCG